MKQSLFAIFIVAVVMLIFSGIATLLWNWLMPTIFGLPTITFWQAYGIMWLWRIMSPFSYQAKTKIKTE